MCWLWHKASTSCSPCHCAYSELEGIVVPKQVGKCRGKGSHQRSDAAAGAGGHSSENTLRVWQREYGSADYVHLQAETDMGSWRKGQRPVQRRSQMTSREPALVRWGLKSALLQPPRTWSLMPDARKAQQVATVWWQWRARRQVTTVWWQWRAGTSSMGRQIPSVE